MTSHIARWSEADKVERLAVVVIASLVLLVVVFALLSWWNQPPQMGANEEVFRTVDALYTAVRSRDLARLDSCSQRLQKQQESGLLPSSAGKTLDRIIQRARGGAWDHAARSLYDFMLVQRREP